MSTQDIPDNELDDFFKKSLEEPHIAFDEEAWTTMEQKLNNAASQQDFFRRLFYSLLLLLGIFTGFTSWYIMDLKAFVAMHTNTQIEKLAVQKEIITEKNLLLNSGSPDGGSTNQAPDLSLNNNKETTDGKKTQNQLSAPSEITGNSLSEDTFPGSPEQYTTSVKSQPGRTKTDTDTKNGLINKNIPGIPAEKPAVRQENNRLAENPVKSTSPDSRTQNTLPIVKAKTGIKKAAAPTEEKISYATTKKTYVKNNTPDNTGFLLLPENQETSIITAGLQEKQAVHSALIEPLTSPSVNLFEVLARNALMLALPEILSGKVPAGALKDTTYKQEIAKRRFRPGFGAGIVLSPDMSSVGFTNWHMPGINAGFFAEYFVSDKWSFSTGAIYSTKIYKATGKDYTPPKGFWGAYKIPPEEVDANCKVLDIPLNVRYNIINQEKFNVFAVAGLSSYFMLKEDYRYKYHYNVDDRYLKKSWRTKNEFKHFFSVVNISAGYERKLSSRFSVQAEPYLKLPLAGVGFGKIKLISTGAFFSLKYKL